MLNLAINQKIHKRDIRYSICTLVTNFVEYEEMIKSFVDAGFNINDCEFRYLDNSKNNSIDAYKGINLFLQESLGEYIIISHQDIILNFDNRANLEENFVELDSIDKMWAIATNAGGIQNSLFRRASLNVFYPKSIEHPNGYHHHKGVFPQKAISVDESFIVIKKSANLALSANLEGFHLYGTDLCLIADLLGYTAYVINFKLTHKSWGNPDESFKILLKKLIKKYSDFMKSRRITTTITDFYLSGSAVKSKVANLKISKKLARKKDKFKTLKRIF